jgi:hypothetical protein
VTLKGENGMMRKRFAGLEKAIDEQKGEIRRLHDAQDALYTTIATHEKDMQAFKDVRRLALRLRACACAVVVAPSDQRACLFCASASLQCSRCWPSF